MSTMPRWQARLAAVPPARWIGWAGVGLAVLAFYLALPPALMRSVVVPAILVALAAGCGVWAIRAGQLRVGAYALVAAAIALVGAIVAVNSGEGNLGRVVVWSALAAAMLRYATPLTFGALGGVISERSGVVNVGLEGMMLTGAFFGAYGADKTGSWVGGILIAMLAGGVLALIHAIWSISLRADQIVAGTAVNFLALGVTGYLYVKLYGEQGTPDDLPSIPDVHLPIGSVPFFGDALGDLNLMVWIGLLLVIAVSVFLFRTARGLRLRSVGENPLAADTAGISPIRMRYAAVIASGVLAAMGGAFLSIGFVHSFSQGMTAGRGFIALAAVISGKWRPGGALAAALLFGFASALAQRLPTFSDSLATLFNALPYVLTLVAVAGLVGRSRAPAADGVPYER
jgi:simple sugar transport system permease protein